MASLTQGRIVHVEMLDPQGRNPKSRPAVVITATRDIHAEGEVTLVAISSRLDAAAPEHQVELPWHAQGHTPTKLTKPSVAVCTWLITVPVGSIAPENHGGMVPGAKVIPIVQKVHALFANRPADTTEAPAKEDASGEQPT